MTISYKLLESGWPPQLINLSQYKKGFRNTELIIGVVVAKSHSQHMLNVLTSHAS